MILDYIPGTKAFTVSVPRSDAALVQSLIRDHGLDFSTSASTPQSAVLFTREAYAAAAFAEHATERAKAQLSPLLGQIASSWKATSDAHIRCPPDKELWAFQKADIEYAMRRNNALVGDQPGLGKTEVAICLANEMRAKHVLVVCPAAIRTQWAHRIAEWTTMTWPYYNYAITTGGRGTHPTDGRPGYNIVSYDLARTEKIGKALSRGIYDLMILDEAHYLKTPDSKRTQAIFGGSKTPLFTDIGSRAGYTLALTGTPLPNRPREAYTIARALCWDSIDWMSEEHFKERFNPSMMREGVRADGSPFQFIDERTGRHAELQNRLRANFMVRHLKRDVMPQLKMPVYDIIQLTETAAIKQALAAESLLDFNPETFEGADIAALGHVSVVRRMMGIAMAPQVADYVKMLIDGGEEKLVLFFWHIEVGDILEQALKKYGVGRIDGSTSPAARARIIHNFQHNDTAQVIIGNLLSMGVGTDGLQTVSAHGLIAEPSWVPGDNIQAFDRLDRGGQTRTVQGDIFVAPGSFAERILAAALRKGQTVHSALDKQFQLRQSSQG